MNLYEAMLLIEKDSTVDPDQVCDVLSEFAEESPRKWAPPTRANERISFELENGKWAIRLKYVDEDWVVLESKELAEGLEPERRARVEQCTRRFEVTTAPDTDGEYFNDYLLAVEKLAELPGVHGVDWASFEWF